MADLETGEECRCGQEHADPAYQRLIAWFDEVYGDKAYRHHDQLVSLIGDEFGDVADKLDQLEAAHKAKGLDPAALAYLGSAQVVRDHAGIV